MIQPIRLADGQLGFGHHITSIASYLSDDDWNVDQGRFLDVLFVPLTDDFTIVAVLESSLTELQRYAERHDSSFPILADESSLIHGQYAIRHSWFGALKGMLFRFPSLLYAMFRKGYVPLTIGGSIDTMPADFLVDRHGIIQQAYYGSDEGDHLNFEQIKHFDWQQAELRSNPA